MLAQRETIHGRPRPIAVASKSFSEVQQRWTPMEREAHGMYEGAMELERYSKGFKKFLFTDHRNNTFRVKMNPSRRISKKLLRIAVELDELDIERVYLAGEWNVLGDAPSRAPIDREIARNLPVPLGPIRDFVRKMFWVPDEIEGDTKKRVEDLDVLAARVCGGGNRPRKAGG